MKCIEIPVKLSDSMKAAAPHHASWLSPNRQYFEITWCHLLHEVDGTLWQKIIESIRRIHAHGAALEITEYVQYIHNVWHYTYPGKNHFNQMALVTIRVPIFTHSAIAFLGVFQLLLVSCTDCRMITQCSAAPYWDVILHSLKLVYCSATGQNTGEWKEKLTILHAWGESFILLVLSFSLKSFLT